MPDVIEATRSPSVLRRTDRLVLAGVGALTGFLHVVAIAVGLRFSAADLNLYSLSAIWQLLPVSLLRHSLFPSLAHLQSQPPLFNVATGLLLQLPHATQPWAADAGMLACAVAIAVATTGLLLELGVHRAVAVAVVVVFVVADPAQFLYSAFYFYALPTAALVTLAGWTAARWARTERVTSGVAYAVCVSALILTNSSYQVYTVALATVPVLWVLRHRWRKSLLALVVPLVFVAAWYGNDLLRFHSATTSSWLGMNLARSTLALDAPADLAALVQQGVLSPIALIRPFQPLASYGVAGTHPPTGQPALDVTLKPGPVFPPNPNYNNIAYIGISRLYLTDDLHWIEHRPWQYVKNTTVGLRLWMLPTEQYYSLVTLPHYHLGGYTTVYDAVVMLQPSADPKAASGILFARRGPSLSNLSITTMLETLLAVVVLPIVAWRRRRNDRARAAGALWVWVTCASVFVTTTLLEAAENNRFRFELGGLPIVAATVAVAWLVGPSLLWRRFLEIASREAD